MIDVETKLIKIYQIDTSFYELAKYSTNQEKILHIINVHRHKIGESNLKFIDISSYTIEKTTYYLYKYDNNERISFWSKFLPSEITKNQNFNLISVSFVLFAVLNSKVFAIIGGNGMFVIQRFLNHRFGLELYEKIADPSLDIVNEITSRGISGNLNQQQEIYKDEQILMDSLSFDRIPIKINLLLRKDLIDSIFDFIHFGSSENIYLEIGTAFTLKWSLSFDEVHQFLMKIDEILNSTSFNSISRFERINDIDFIQKRLLEVLYDAIREDMMNTVPDDAKPYSKFDNDFVHPSKLSVYYCCDKYELFTKNAKKSFFQTHDRRKLYKEGLKYLYTNTNLTDRFEFIKTLLGIRVIGYQDSKKKTEATFIQHLTCEINFAGKPYFLIDHKWFMVKGDFIEAINIQCINMIKRNYWNNHPLSIDWNASIDEGEYNLKYSVVENFLVLDKMLGQNIELCDLLYEDNNNIYLIHIKKGFDAKIRDLYNQILISAKRLWNDISSGSFEFLDGVYDRYIEKNANTIDKSEFRNKFQNKTIIYVMAFSSGYANGKSVMEDIRVSKSNIAKFSLIQCVQEMKTKNYDLKIIEIKNV